MLAVVLCFFFNNMTIFRYYKENGTKYVDYKCSETLF